MLAFKRRGFEATAAPGVGATSMALTSATLIGTAPPVEPIDFEYPVGIPDFPWDFTQDIPTLPSPWNTSTTGFYYVRQGGSASNNGTPSAPRGTIPTLSTVPAGSVVVIDNTADMTFTNLSLNPVGSSSSSLVWLVGAQQVGLGSGSSKAVLRYTGDCTISSGSQWFIIDGIDFFCNTANQNGWGASRCTNYVIRNCIIRANGGDRSANSSNFIGGSNTTTRAQFGMFWGNVVRDLGLYTHVGGDIDCHGIQIGQWVDDHWFIDNEFYHNQGDGIQVTGSGSPSANTPSVIRRLYVGRNFFYENLQTGFWIKTGTDIIFSQNTVYGHTDGGGSAPIGCGGQYDFTNAWFILNRIRDNPNGIRFASANNGVSPVIRCLGNVITGMNASGVQNNSAFSDGCGIAFWQGGTTACCFNTISGFNGHGIAATNGSGNDMRIENNIIRNRTNASSWDIFIESISTQPKVRNNFFPSSPRFSINGASATSVSAFESASAANRSSNLSGTVTVENDVTGAAGDYAVVAGSVTINQGLITTDLFTEFQTAFGKDIRKDFLGVTRPQFTSYDIGAYESTTNTSLAVGNSALVVQRIGEGQGTAPTAAFDTSDGFLFAAVGRGALSDFSTATVTDNASNTLAMTGTTHSYSPQWPLSGTACFFKANATGRAGCIVTDSKPDNSDEVTVLAINIIGATQIESSSFIYDQTGPTNVGTDITVTEDSVLICVWAGNHENGENNPQFSSGWTRRLFTTLTNGNHVQMALATRVVSPGTYGVTVTPGTSQGGQIYLFGVN